MVRASALVDKVVNSEKLTEEQSGNLLLTNQRKLNLTPEQIKRWSGKRYIVLIELKEVQSIEPFAIDRSGYGTMDDWLPVEAIENVMN
jgi:hypothetical protein